jgi:hypothetical protein
MFDDKNALSQVRPGLTSLGVAIVVILTLPGRFSKERAQACGAWLERRAASKFPKVHMLAWRRFA